MFQKWVVRNLHDFLNPQVSKLKSKIADDLFGETEPSAPISNRPVQVQSLGVSSTTEGMAVPVAQATPIQPNTTGRRPRVRVRNPVAQRRSRPNNSRYLQRELPTYRAYEPRPVQPIIIRNVLPNSARSAYEFRDTTERDPWIGFGRRTFRTKYPRSTFSSFAPRGSTQAFGYGQQTRQAYGRSRLSNYY